MFKFLSKFFGRRSADALPEEATLPATARKALEQVYAAGLRIRVPLAGVIRAFHAARTAAQRRERAAIAEELDRLDQGNRALLASLMEPSGPPVAFSERMRAEIRQARSPQRAEFQISAGEGK